eukprot:TRINITY_DN2816_c2_g1_i1.p1 TRINITY_DN2816_c2_g1~~TRINITY_DN2816_c2_g1_i1.p1  ORF type:complete len:530 (+),score=124.06 TRINITY_DN2816_c2_g1_i1:254-1843(+)
MMMIGSMPGAKESEEDPFFCYEPLSKDGAFVCFRPKAPEDYSEAFKPERSLSRYTPVATPKIRRLISAVRGREILAQKKEAEAAQEVAAGLTSGKKVDGDDMQEKTSLLQDEKKTELELDTEAEDSEVEDAQGNEPCDGGRPTFHDVGLKSKEALDGCSYLVVRSKGPLRPADEPPDFLMLPEPIKQRTAGAVRVAAAARAWAAASAVQPGQSQQAAMAWQAGQAGAGVARPMNQNAQLPATARGPPTPGNNAASIAAELLNQQAQGQGQGQARADPGGAGGTGGAQAGQAIAESRETVAGPAVLALRRMRNRMSALAEGRLPWSFSRQSQGGQRQPPQPPQQQQQQQPPQQQQQQQQPQQQLQPQPPQHPHNGQRRPMLPNVGARSAAPSSAAPAGAPSAAPAAAQGGGASSSGAAAPSSGAAAASDGDLQMQSLVPTAPAQPKPPSSANGSSGRPFWRRNWPRVNLGSLGWGGSSSSGGASSSNQAASSNTGGASGSRGPSQPGSAGQDVTPSSAAGSAPHDPASPQ